MPKLSQAERLSRSLRAYRQATRSARSLNDHVLPHLRARYDAARAAAHYTKSSEAAWARAMEEERVYFRARDARDRAEDAAVSARANAHRVLSEAGER